VTSTQAAFLFCAVDHKLWLESSIGLSLKNHLQGERAMMEETTKKIISILGEVKENPVLAEQWTGDSKMIAEIGLDSLEMINFVLRIEDEFNIEINFDRFDYANLEDVKTFAAFIKNSQLHDTVGVAL
jgi:acyl carrier protein